MGRFRPYIMLLLILLLLAQPTYGQDQTRPVVGIVTDPDIYSLSYVGEESGIGQLAAIFRALGADVQRLNLDTPIPDNIQVIVMVRPVNRLTPQQLARLWTSIEDGANFLLALDPQGYKGINGEPENGSLNRLLFLDFGLSFHNTFLAETWFHRQALEDFQGSLLQTNAEDVVLHPIVDPLRTYGLPVYLWGARTLDVAGLWPSSSSYPLIYTETAYGERTDVTRENAVFEVNIGEDFTGRLFAGGIGINFDTETRVVLLGDSEMLQDDYGLSVVEGTTQPNFVGNYVLAQRLAAWLLELPESEWLPLPEGFTWLAIDGDASDWDVTLPMVEDAALDVDAPAYDIAQVHTFYNDQAIYLLIQTQETPAAAVEVEILFSSSDGTDTSIRLSTETISLPEAAADAGFITGVPMAVGEAIEIRLPLSLFENPPALQQLCIKPNDDTETQDCLEAPVEPASVSLRDTVPLGAFAGPLGTINTNGPVNLLSKPIDDTSVVTILERNTPVALLGRSEDSQWLKIWRAGYTGWLPDFQLLLNIDKENLPVVGN